MTPTPLATKLDSNFGLIAESMPQILWIVGCDGSVEFLNIEASAYTGLLGTSNPSWNWVSLVHPDESVATSKGVGITPCAARPITDTSIASAASMASTDGTWCASLR